MRIAIHQANFIPHFPYFEKMAMADIFVILTECQFEKGGYQNRQKINGSWWTKPVCHGLEPLNDKRYTDGNNLVTLNMEWIEAIAHTLGIDTSHIAYDFKTDLEGTDRLIEICQQYGADEYISSPDATAKYLDAEKFSDAGIRIIPFHSQHKKHVFEMFDEIGIEKCIKIIKRRYERLKTAV